MASTNWQINTWFQHLTKTTEKYTLRCLIGAWKFYLKAIKKANSVKLILFKFANIEHEWSRRLLFCKHLTARVGWTAVRKGPWGEVLRSSAPWGEGGLYTGYTARLQARVRAYAARKKIFWNHFFLVTIQVFTSGTWTPTRLKNGGK